MPVALGFALLSQVVVDVLLIDWAEVGDGDGHLFAVAADGE